LSCIALGVDISLEVGLVVDLRSPFNPGSLYEKKLVSPRLALYIQADFI
jgi:hypothetical protein